MADAPRLAPVPGWEHLPAGLAHRDVAAVAVDRNDRVYLATRVRSCIFVYERDGTFVRTWGEGVFTDRLHGLTLHPDGTLFIVDDAGHAVRHFTVDGKELAPIGPVGTPSDTGYDGANVATVARAAGPYNRPTNLAVAPSGDLYVSDGYGNARVHQFSAEGKLIRSWGEPGTAPGQFKISHGICVLADGRVLVCDRENDRIQVFSPDGAYLKEWRAQRPTHLVLHDGLLYVAELWWAKGQKRGSGQEVTKDEYGRVSILDLEGTLVARYGGGAPNTPGNFCAPHGIAVDSRGDVYVAEVTYTIGASRGLVPDGTPTLQKLVRS
ncbi:MAG TPA: peptidyl-alpha-hydroxyglycine alpha-amidating lyase family protein [Acidimicrobiia bacterium]|nr:peptidyl-alpha-hydroxyglycine alpha-amidating lyase family protein [Acidimicrobiia bacterium]